MKKIMQCFLACSLLVLQASALPPYATAETPSETLFGDVNGDESVNNVDAALILKHDAGVLQLSDAQLQYADYNRDGSVDNVDAALILKYDAGIMDSHGKIIDVKFLGQEPDYPCGCEGISAVMLLDYHGYNVSPKHFFDNALDTFPFTYDWRTDTYYGEDMDRYYIGDPTSKMGKGCYAPVIKSAVEKIVSDKHIAVVEQGVTVAELADKYIRKMNRPVLIWATSLMRDSFAGTIWRIDRNNGYFTFPAYMHCLVLVGYDNDSNMYYFNDPYLNQGLIAYDKDLVEAKFKELGSQALALMTREEYSSERELPEPNCTYAIRNAATGKYISVLNNTAVNGTNVIQKAYSGAASQHFIAIKNNNGSYSFVNEATNKAIDVMNINTKYVAGCNVHQYTYNGSKAQRFILTEQKGFYNLALECNPNINLSVFGNYNGDKNNTSSSLGNVFMAAVPENLDYYQLWEFVPVDEGSLKD